jgi:hypothetical protein
MQEIDAERRIQILRGERPAPLPAIEDSQDDQNEQSRSSMGGRDWKWKKRKRAAEDDTDFELRVARDEAKSFQPAADLSLRDPTSDAPLTDQAGHISLFPQAASKLPVAKNPEAEHEASRKRKEYEDQYTMRFANAAGFKQGLDKPWYSRSSTAVDAAPIEEVIEAAVPSKDVWGNEDPRRKQREAERMATSDPLAAMRQGAAQVRRVERERKRWQEERDREMVELLKAEQERKDRRERRKRRRRDDGEAASEDDLEGFSVDKQETTSSRHRRDSKGRRSRHQDLDRDSHRRFSHKEKGRERERERERERSRDRNSYRHGDDDRHRRHHRR